MPAKWDWPLAAPLKLRANAVEIDWNPDPKAPRLPLLPVAKRQPAEQVTLIPYGCTKFRISIPSGPGGPATPSGCACPLTRASCGPGATPRRARPATMRRTAPTPVAIPGGSTSTRGVPYASVSYGPLLFALPIPDTAGRQHARSLRPVAIRAGRARTRLDGGALGDARPMGLAAERRP